MPHRVFYTMVRLTSYGIKNNLDNDSGLVGQVKAYMEGVFNMKKWFRPVRVVKKYIDIVVNMDDYKDYKTDTSVAVNPYFPMKVSRPSAIKDWKISDEALSLYIDFLNCVLHIIWSHGLKITKQYWAKKTYTYNIEVKHYGYIHDEKVKYIMLFRVNNHINPTLNRGPKFNGGREMTMPVLQDIRVGKFESSIYPDAKYSLQGTTQSRYLTGGSARQIFHVMFKLSLVAATVVIIKSTTRRLSSKDTLSHVSR